VAARRRPVGDEGHGRDRGADPEPARKRAVAQSEDRDGARHHGQRIEARHGDRPGDAVQRIVELRAVGDVRTVDRDVRCPAGELQGDADEACAERGRREPAARSLGLAKHAPQAGEEGREEGEGGRARDVAGGRVALAVAVGHGEGDGEDGSAGGGGPRRDGALHDDSLGLR